jgi:hypothetical protein
MLIVVVSMDILRFGVGKGCKGRVLSVSCCSWLLSEGDVDVDGLGRAKCLSGRARTFLGRSN